MTRLNVTLQGKGGVGKSVVATLLAQHRRDRDYELVCLDTDPVNATFSQFQGLEVQRVEIMKGLSIHPRTFDRIVEETLKAPPNSELIVDCGATSFISLSAYLIENYVGQYLADSGDELVLHVVLVGGQAAVDSLNGLNAIATQLPSPTRIVVWFNEFFGAVETEFEDQKVDLKDTAAFHNSSERIDGTVTLFRGSDLAREDLQKLLSNGHTIGEGLLDDSYSIMARSRLKNFRKNLWQQLDSVLGKPPTVSTTDD